MPAAGVRTKAGYNKILDAFRQTPGNYAGAGRIAGVNQKTARRAWEHGWPRWTWARPIRDVLKEEADQTMARVAARLEADDKEATEERAKSRKASLLVKEEEEKILLACRRNVVALLGITARSLVVAEALVGKLTHETCEMGVDRNGAPALRPKPGATIKLDPEKCGQLLERLSRVQSKAVELAGQVLDQGRLSRGEPTAFVEHSVSRDLSPEQAAEEIEAQDQAIGIIREEAARAVKAGATH